MSLTDFNEVVERIQAENDRFHPDAYRFVREGLDYTLRTLRERGELEERAHISGECLLEGIRAYALEQYGPLTLTVFGHWGLSNCRDFGVIVFDLVNYGVLGKNENDRIEDFENGYDFEEAFGQPFRPSPPEDPSASAPE